MDDISLVVASASSVVPGSSDVSGSCDVSGSSDVAGDTVALGVIGGRVTSSPKRNLEYSTFRRNIIAHKNEDINFQIR